MNTAELQEHFVNCINWQRFINLVASVGDQFNDAQWRFLKATIFENSLEEYSDGSVKYVGEDGCDLIVNKNIRVEVKFIAGGFHTTKKGQLKKHCPIISLMSSQGTNKHKELPKNYADYLLIVSPNSAALVDKKTLNQNISVNGDGISAILPTSVLKFIFSPVDLKKPKVYKINLREEINKAIKCAIKKVRSTA